MIIGRQSTLPPVTAVPSTLWGLTSLFGMGRGEHPSYSHPEDFLGHQYLNKFHLIQVY